MIHEVALHKTAANACERGGSRSAACISADEYVVVAKIRLRRAVLVTLPFTFGDELIVGTKCERAATLPKSRFHEIIRRPLGTHDFIA